MLNNVVVDRVEPLLSCGLTGILRAASGVENILPIVHGPMSCSSYHRVIPLQAGKLPIVPTTTLTDVDMARGTENILRISLIQYFKLYKPRILVVILTCATNLISEYLDPILSEVSLELKVPILKLDGSTLAGNEVQGYEQFYQAIKNLLWGRTSDQKEFSGDLCLHGLGAGDYGINNEINELRAILENGFMSKVRGSLFVNFDPDKDVSLFDCSPIYCGWLWTLMKEWIPAPYGINGTRQFLEQWSSILRRPIDTSYYAKLDEYTGQMASVKKMISSKPVRVAIEGLSWWTIGLGKFLREELGCNVLISSDAAANEYQLRYGPVVDELLVDVGNYELLTYLDSFQPQIVFGSSILKKGPWLWIPFYQPIWHDVKENPGFLGPDGAIKLASLLLGGNLIYA